MITRALGTTCAAIFVLKSKGSNWSLIILINLWCYVAREGSKSLRDARVLGILLLAGTRCLLTLQLRTEIFAENLDSNAAHRFAAHLASGLLARCSMILLLSAGPAPHLRPALAHYRSSPAIPLEDSYPTLNTHYLVEHVRSQLVGNTPYWHHISIPLQRVLH
jgi:hypothetical protein